MMSLILTASLFVSAATMACQSGNLCAGDRIIDQENLVGRVVEVFNNGQARVRLDGYLQHTVRSAAYLGKGVQCHENFCVGDRIIDQENLVGRIVEIFSNGKAKVSLDGYLQHTVRSVAYLGKGYRCIENVCTGDRIIDRENLVGTIVEIFDNGRVKVSFDGYLQHTVRSFRSLGIELNCLLRDNCSCQN